MKEKPLARSFNTGLDSVHVQSYMYYVHMYVGSGAFLRTLHGHPPVLSGHQPTEPPLHHDGYPRSTSAAATLYDERTDHALHYRDYLLLCTLIERRDTLLVRWEPRKNASPGNPTSPDPRPNVPTSASAH